MDELLLEFLREFKSTCGHSNWTKTVSIGTIHFCIYFCTNVGLGCSLLKHALDIHEIVAPVSNRDIVLFLLIVTGKFAAYFMLLNLTSIILSVVIVILNLMKSQSCYQDCQSHGGP